LREAGAAIAVEGLDESFSGPTFVENRSRLVRDLNPSCRSRRSFTTRSDRMARQKARIENYSCLARPTRGRTKIFGCDSSLVKVARQLDSCRKILNFYKFLTGRRDAPILANLPVNGARG